MLDMNYRIRFLHISTITSLIFSDEKIKPREVKDPDKNLPARRIDALGQIWHSQTSSPVPH